MGNGSKAWGGWSRDCLEDLWPFSKVVMLGIVGIGAEWYAEVPKGLCQACADMHHTGGHLKPSLWQLVRWDMSPLLRNRLS